MPLPSLFLDAPADRATPIHPIRAGDWTKWSEQRPDTLRALAAAHDFKGQAARILLVPATDGSIERVLFGLGDKANAAWLFGALGAAPAVRRLHDRSPRTRELPATLEAVAWGHGRVRIRRATKPRKAPPRLAPPAGADMAEAARIVEAIWLARDLVNTPTNDMGPEALQDAAASRRRRVRRALRSDRRRRTCWRRIIR